MSLLPEETRAAESLRPLEGQMVYDFKFGGMLLIKGAYMLPGKHVEALRCLIPGGTLAHQGNNQDNNIIIHGRDADTIFQKLTKAGFKIASLQNLEQMPQPNSGRAR